jgi:hypothetical protein
VVMPLSHGLSDILHSDRSVGLNKRNVQAA